MKQRSTIAENQKLNTIRPGSVYVSDRNDQLRYVDKNGSEGWVVPVSRYYASTEILRGQAVSICQLHELDEDMAKDEFPYIRPTDPDKDDSCLGLACNYAAPGELVQVQNTGKFIFSKRYQELHNAESTHELPVDFDEYTYGNVRGQRVYVKKLDTENFDANESDKQTQIFAGDFTFDLKESADVTKNTLQIGYLVDAPTADELEAYDVNDEDKDCEVIIELDVTGDTRGAIGATQSTVVLGEDIYFGDGADEVKALALSTGEPSEAKFEVTHLVEEDFAFDSTKQYFIGFRKLDGKAVIISVGNDVTLKNLDDPTDAGYYILSKSFGDNFEQIKANGFEDLEEKIKEAIETVSGDTPTVEDLAVRNSNGYCSSYVVSTAKKEGYYDMYISQDLCRFMAGYTLNHGIAEGTKGYAVLADIRDDSRSNVIGICLSNQEGTRKAGETVVVMKQGTYHTKSSNKNYTSSDALILEPGARYILGYNGKITKTNEPNYHDAQVVIGQAENANTLFVDVSQPLYTYKGNMPVGYIKSANSGKAEHGFLLMDGVTEYETERYPELYEALLDWYSKAEIAGSDETHFKIPVSKTGDCFNEIRYKCEGLYRDVPRTPFLRVSGKFEDHSIKNIDITSLVRYGTLEQGMVAPTLDNVDIKLYYREPAGEAKNLDGMNWREVQPGFAVHNNTQLYGFDWSVAIAENNLYTLVMNIEDGLGPCKVQASQPPISLEGLEYKVVITARNLWTREYNVDEANPLATSMEQNSDNIAPSVKAVADWVDKSVTTNELEVKDSLTATKEAVDIKVPFTSKKIKEEADKVALEHNGEMQEPLFQDTMDAHEALDASNCAKDDNENFIPVHGLVNAGAEGNIDANTIAGIKVKQGVEDDTVKNLDSKKEYVPYVNKDGQMTIGNKVVQQVGKDSSVTTTIEGSKSITTTPVTTEEVTRDNTKFTTEYKTAEGGKPLVDHKYNAAYEHVGAESADVTTLKVTKVLVGEEDVTGHLTSGASSLAYKTVEKELIDTQVSDALPSSLTPNRDTDADGNPVGDTELAEVPKTLDGDLNEELKYASAKLGSALQALYELPLGLFRYKSEINSYEKGGKIAPKDLLGILVERVNQVRDNLNTVPNYTHSKNSYVASDVELGIKASDNARIANNTYGYTKEEYDSIKDYLNLITSSDELSQNILSSVGVLFKAAKETQQRLLDVETAVYGFDAPTLPGDTEAHEKVIKDRISEDLVNVLNHSPLLLGLNRIVRALCLEIFNTAELEDIKSLVENKDSSEDSEDDSLSGKQTLASRLDKIDDLLDNMVTQLRSITQAYLEQQKEVYDHLTIAIDNGTTTDSIDPDHKLNDLIDRDRLANDDTDTEGTFDNLPSTSDYDEKATVAYGSVYDKAHTYNPTADEKSIIKTWKTEEVTYSTNLYTGDTAGKEYTYTTFVLNGEDNTPAYKESIVSWLDDKVERINKKLSEVTEAVYGADDVIADEPNRIETVRKNITNLVDDLYKNRQFAVENKVDCGDDTLRLPFKQVITGSEAHTEDAIPAKDATLTEYAGVDDHTSIITHIDNELWNFTIGQELIDADTNTNYIANDYSQKVTFNEGKFTFSTDRLTTEMEDNEENNVKTYDRALSFVDILRKELGADHSFAKDVNSSSIWDAIVKSSTADYSKAWWLDTASSTKLSNGRVKSVFNKELGYEVSGTEDTHVGATKLSNDYTLATNAEVYLSRKNKDVESRIASVEAALDNFAHAFEVIKASDFEKRQPGSGTYDINGDTKLSSKSPTYRTRFEASQPLDAITELLNKFTAIENTNNTDSYVQSDEFSYTYDSERLHNFATLDVFKACFVPYNHTKVYARLETDDGADIKALIKDYSNGYYRIDATLNTSSQWFSSSSTKVDGGVFNEYENLFSKFTKEGITKAKLYVVYANDKWANDTIKTEVVAPNGVLAKSLLDKIGTSISTEVESAKVGSKYTNTTEKFYYNVDQDTATFVVVLKDCNAYIDSTNLKETVDTTPKKGITATSNEHTFEVNYDSYGLETGEGINYEENDSYLAGFKPIKVTGYNMKDYAVMSMLYTAMANAQLSVENFKSAEASIDATDTLLNRSFNHLFGILTQLTGDLYGSAVNDLFSNGTLTTPGTDQGLKAKKVEDAKAASVLSTVSAAKTSGEKATALNAAVATAMNSTISKDDTFATLVNKLNSEAKGRRDFILSMVDYITSMEANKNADKKKIEELNKRVEALEAIVVNALGATTSAATAVYKNSSNGDETLSYTKYSYTQGTKVTTRDHADDATATTLEARVKNLEDGYSSVRTSKPSNTAAGTIYLL